MLNSEEIKKLIKEKDLITDYIDLEKQIQPCGFDLSLREVHAHTSKGSVDFSNKERRIASKKLIKPDLDGWYKLSEGCYIIVYNETVRVPLDLAAIARTRSSVLRNGATLETAVWDPGYQGRSSSLLVVHNSQGINLKKDARLVQLIFFQIKKVEEGYSGTYQRERIDSIKK